MSPPSEEHRTALGRAVREIRASRGRTLRGLADALAISPATLSAIENGKTGVSSERIARIADELDVPVHRIFSTAEDVSEQPRPSAGAARADWRVFAPLQLDPALAGALSAFVEFGYHGASMRTIAERAGLSVPGLYHHHASKQEMLVALLDLTMSDLLSRSEAARAEGSTPAERFALLVECLALYHTHRRELAFVGASEMRSLGPANHRRLAATRVEQQRMVDAEVEAGVLSGEFATDLPHEAARAVVTMCTALAQWFRTPGPSTPEEVAAQYVRFALDLVRHVPR
ncbi:TetR family transcriptional regulator [Aeromicrobium wangtongii]|uniref:TetR family transcriptional regulator n=1 Tax=Aeromicrobium wangtongii TaxID=2969247 RepID=A0ABY5MBB9_9ACTN|nr:TetR family transcriptional regulator [Aeromicrobium wangtongii]MCD9197942.1 TetR family transcriptional regulator [Aeromicrobium wangtongii]UUP15420.1 TetR family transcriptional regulator [Aeromicrobium wangtongii]